MSPPPIHLKWENINYSVNVGGLCSGSQKKQILTDVSGEARPKELVAIIGPSGAGKTSLLNVLCKRLEDFSGTLDVNSTPFKQKIFKRVAAYVMQDDVMMDVATPLESLLFSARLRLSREVPDRVKKAFVREILEKLGLQRVQNSYIRELSGGERKRTSIGVEMVTNPGLLFLDEPTSGLDSYTAYSVMETIQSLTQEGRTAVATIHQPSSELFSLFTRLIVLSHGRLVYNGPMSKSISFFSKIGYEVPQYSNPADYFMMVLQAVDEKDKSRVDRLCADAKGLLTNDSEFAQEPFDEPPKKALKQLKQVKHVSKLYEFLLLVLRAGLRYIREPLGIQVRFLQTIFMALLVLLLYFDMDRNQSSIQDRIGALFFMLITFIMTSLQSVILTFPLERKVFLREYNSGTYGLLTYYFGKSFSEFPFQIIFSAAFTGIVYWAVGLYMESWLNVVYFLVIMYMLGLAAGAFGLFIGCAVPDPTAAVSLGPMAIIPMMLLGGFFVNLENIPVWISWLKWISLFKYGFELIAINEFAGAPFHCDDDEYLTVGMGQQICPVTDGDQVLDNLSIDPDVFYTNFAILGGIILGFHLLSLITLKFHTVFQPKR
eukprot:NODE_173_length_2004_cov_14.973895_g149_i0.p1 GENE.NODE_173_length_2004_cov_14.973895_g149_i0~~NODE_173_length_2004_cov_14.973895_g149_i0.p1  ORF type:complete len:601 (+),score=114.99 NODE_173_length_2004_cov_14.973895_g149_i0:136-1938(+)